MNQSNNHHQNSKKAMLLVWNTNEIEQFWSDFSADIYPLITKLHNKGELSYVFPFQHKPLNHPEKTGTWTNSVLIGLNDKNHAQTSAQILELINNSSVNSNLVAADLLNLQKGLDMFYSVDNGLAQQDELEQIVEYVFSKPQEKKILRRTICIFWPCNAGTSPTRQSRTFYRF